MGKYGAKKFKMNRHQRRLKGRRTPKIEAEKAMKKILKFASTTPFNIDLNITQSTNK